MFERILPGRREKRLEREIRTAADAHPPQDSVQIFVVASPPAPHFASLSGDINIALQVVGVVPFGVRPFEIIDASIQGYHGGQWMCSCQIRNRPVTAEFLGPGKSCLIPLTQILTWAKDRQLPKSCEALHVDVSGTLRLHAPWSVEYGNVSFKSAVWVQVRP